VLAFFDEDKELQAMQRLINDNLLGENSPAYFGDQLVCDQHDAVVDQESRLLMGATTLTVDFLVANIHRFGGLAIASHVDRERFSLISQLGFVPEGLQLDGMEISALHSQAEAIALFPSIADYPLLQSSDAHQLKDLGKASTTCMLASPCVAELRKALQGQDDRKVVV
jgi:PHP family Zn ribbon phosphoesterase